MNFFNTNRMACKPVTTLHDLLNWSQQIELAKSRQYTVQKLKNTSNSNDKEKRRQMIVCHDMRNNYLQDRFFQGSNNPKDFSFYHWNLIDMFIYFSHHFVTVPPESWINAAHENNVRMLGKL